MDIEGTDDSDEKSGLDGGDGENDTNYRKDLMSVYLRVRREVRRKRKTLDEDELDVEMLRARRKKQKESQDHLAAGNTGKGGLPGSRVT